MFRVWIKGHILPIGAETLETVEGITTVYGFKSIEKVEKQDSAGEWSHYKYGGIKGENSRRPA